MGLRPTHGDESRCHSERSEGSAFPAQGEPIQILRFAQNDRPSSAELRALQRSSAALQSEKWTVPGRGHKVNEPRPVRSTTATSEVSLGSTQDGHFVHIGWEMGAVILQCQIVTIIDFGEKGRNVNITVSSTVKCGLSPESNERTRNVYENKA